MISTSDDLFMISVIVVALLAVAVALSLRITCNYIHRNAQNELYRSFYERHIQEYYRKVSSFFRRRQQPQERVVSRHVLNTDDFQKMNQRNTATRFPFEIQNQERPPLSSVDPNVFRQSSDLRTPLDQMQDPLINSRLYKTTDFSNAPQKQRDSMPRRTLPFLRQSGTLVSDMRNATQSFNVRNTFTQVMGPIPEEPERSSKGGSVQEEKEEEVQQENVAPVEQKMERKVPAALRHSEFVTKREHMGLMYGQKRKFD